MSTMSWRSALAALFVFATAVGSSAVAAGKGNPMVVLTTSMGDIKVELYPDKAPVTVKNFLDYVKAGYYNGTIFHRVIPGFMVQGGGLTPDMQDKREGQRPAIKNEADNGLKNEVGTIAMARTSGSPGSRDIPSTVARQLRALTPGRMSFIPTASASG